MQGQLAIMGIKTNAGQDAHAKQGLTHLCAVHRSGHVGQTEALKIRTREKTESVEATEGISTSS